MTPYLDFGPWSRFVNQVAEAELELGEPGPMWYRGVSDARFALVSSLLRFANGRDKEELLFLKYKQVASRMFAERRTEWEVLFDMQHHYIPTRLLDWTEVLGVAVFFALLGERDIDSAVYVLNPTTLNQKFGRDNVPLVSEDPEFSYKKIYWKGHPVQPTYPIAIEAPYQNDRILAQRGKFTIHGYDEQPLEVLVPDAVRKVILRSDVRESASEYLRISGINEFSMFPDIVGAAPYLREVVGLR